MCLDELTVHLIDVFDTASSIHSELMAQQDTHRNPRNVSWFPVDTSCVSLACQCVTADIAGGLCTETTEHRDQTA